MRVLLCLCLLVPLAALAAEPVPRSHDEHSWSEPDKVVIRDLGLDLRVDFDKKEIRGSADLALEWKDPDYRVLVLDTRDLSIDRVLGKRADSGWFRLRWELGPRDPVFGQKLTIRMRKPYESVRIRYRTAPGASGLQWLEPGMTAGGKMPFMFSQSQAIHARSWVPLQDTPSVRYTYSAHVESDPSIMVLMSADNPPQTRRDGDYVFRMNQPIPSYLMAIAAGDLKFKPISTRAGVWAEPPTLEAAVAEFADTERMIQVTESLYGPYRWQRYDLLILPPSFPFGGMENPRLSFITPTVITGDKSLVSLIAHELAHSWSGNLVTNASWKDMWLNEGFTSYVENRIVEEIFGVEQAAMENVISLRDLTDEMAELDDADELLMHAPAPGRDPDDLLTDVAYVKGMWFLRFLEQRIGREPFDVFLRSWFDRHAFQSVTSEQFLAQLREYLASLETAPVSEAELVEWLQRPGMPASAPEAVSQRFAAVDRVRAAWLKGDVVARDVDVSNWITQEWVYFLDGMPDELEGSQLVELDEAFHFTGTRNGEVAMRWYPLAVRSGYFEARPSIAEFLKSIGRRKLIGPIYEALAESEEGLAFARKVFAEASAGYHPITRASFQAVLYPKAD
ncbi:MAG: M1 family metallopeptidase [Xanthomonadales bacterium]|nr:M1 family metallopeptidase [Xanthomonadales bacterium]